MGLVSPLGRYQTGLTEITKRTGRQPPPLRFAEIIYFLRCRLTPDYSFLWFLKKNAANYIRGTVLITLILRSVTAVEDNLAVCTNLNKDTRSIHKDTRSTRKDTHSTYKDIRNRTLGQ